MEKSEAGKNEMRILQFKRIVSIPIIWCCSFFPIPIDQQPARKKMNFSTGQAVVNKIVFVQ